MSGNLAYECKYDKITDKKFFIPELQDEQTIADSQGTGVGAMDSLKGAIGPNGSAAAIATNNDATKSKYLGELFFTKRPKQYCRDTKEPVYKINQTLNEYDQGLFGQLGGNFVDMAKSIGTITDVAKGLDVECKKIKVKSCYEQGLRVEPIDGPFEINMRADDKDGLRLANNLYNNRIGHALDKIPYDYLKGRVKIPCESFDNIDEYSNYTNSIKEFNGPNYTNYIRNVYFTALFIFLFYIFMKLYVKKK
tara:strand:- start:1191 stop:1940 length:750 start_codon:yes stop_codon:yes gene_type:complete